jgi:hypothetical protein
MKAGGPYCIYPAILSQIRNPPVLIRNSTLESLPRHQEFLPVGFISVIWRAWVKFPRRDFRKRKFLNFVQGKSRILPTQGFDPPTNEPSVANLTTRLLFRPCTKIPSRKIRSRSSDDADKSCRKKFLMMWKRFQSGIPYQDRRMSSLGEYCGIHTITSSGLHSFNEQK